MSLPIVLLHPSVAGLAPRFAELGECRQFTDLSGEDAQRVRACVTLGSEGVPRDLLERLPNLGLIACFTAGYEGVDLGYARERGIAVTNCAGVNAEDVADVAMGLVISCWRKIAEGDRRVRAGEWRGIPAMVTSSLKGKKLGIVGMGAIGRALATRAAPFRLDMRWNGPRPKSDVAFPYEPDLHALATWADILAVCVVGNPETEGLVDAAVIAALGPQGVLINVARGSVVDESALIEALKAGRLGGAGLDVFAQEPTLASQWMDVPNTTLTPHLGGAVRESLIESGRLVHENVRRFLAGEPLLTPV